jgi:hypothetical protein
LENNQKKIIYPIEGMIYIIKPIIDIINLFKLGYSENMNLRTPTYNTTLSDDVHVIFIMKVNDVKVVEKILKIILLAKRR